MKLPFSRINGIEMGNKRSLSETKALKNSQRAFPLWLLQIALAGPSRARVLVQRQRPALLPSRHVGGSRGIHTVLL